MNEKTSEEKDKTDKSGLYGKVICALCIGVIIVYSAVVLVNWFLSGIEPTTLTVSVFAFFGTELGFLAAKRILCGKEAAAKYDPKSSGNGSLYDWETEDTDY